MKDKKELEIWQQSLRINNLNELAKLKCFLQLQGQLKEKTLANSELYTLTLLKKFTLVTTPLRQFKDVLRNIADVSFTDHATNKRYYVIFDSLFNDSKLAEKLKGYPIQTYQEYTLPHENKITIHIHESKIKKINHKKNYIENAFFNTESLEITPTEKPKLYIILKNTLEEQLKSFQHLFNKDVNYFYQYFIIPRICIYQSGLIFQTYFNKATMPASFLNSLTPAKFKNSCLPKNPEISNTVYIYDKHTRTYTYQIDSDTLKNQAAANFAKFKHVALPASIFKNAFAPKALGDYKIGLPFLITCLFGYKGGKHPLIQLKTSNWIKYGNLSLRRGKKALCNSFNAKCEYLQKIGLITTYDTMSVADIRYDRVLKVRLCPASYL